MSLLTQWIYHFWSQMIAIISWRLHIRLLTSTNPVPSCNQHCNMMAEERRADIHDKGNCSEAASNNLVDIEDTDSNDKLEILENEFHRIRSNKRTPSTKGVTKSRATKGNYTLSFIFPFNATMSKKITLPILWSVIRLPNWWWNSPAVIWVYGSTAD